MGMFQNLTMNFVNTGNFPWMDNVLAYFKSDNPAYKLLHNISLELVKIRRKEEGKVSK